ncbi:hypothetical protein CY35_16G055900 [Sphagnum magellanicum]|nr:hypothetical protein CY35_16G055900 [Sphagnum magellanicum]
MVVIAGCKGQQQGLQPVCRLPFSSCDLVVAAARISSSSRRRISYRGHRTSANVVAMSSLFRPCCNISVASPFEPRVNNSREGRRRISRLVCMVADTNADRRQQQKQQQQSPLQQQQQRELSPAVDEEKEQLTTQEEETEEEEMSMIMTEDESQEFPSSTGAIAFASSVASAVGADAATAMTQRMKERKRERMAYLFAAVASSVGFVTLAAGAVYYRFIWQMEDNGEVPYGEMLGTFSLAIGAAVGMEFWARWAHQALWHASLWNMHESHHKPRQGPFELNDIFAIINAVPAITLITIGFFNHGFVPGLCFGGGLGITMFGMAYMFVHDGLVHRRFPVGPIADFPYLQKVAAAHQLHHADLFGGVPYGLFLGPKELEEVGGQDELQKVLNVRYKNREGDREG